ATSVDDARALLAEDVAPGASVEVGISVRAPDVPGTYRFAARMVDEGVAWFGTTGTAAIAVTPDDGDPTNDNPDQINPVASGGGCNAGGADAGLVVVLVLVLVAISAT